MSSPFDALLEQVTGPLRVDPELRWEVRRELQIHLEDATAEYERGGYAPEQARATAMRALGEPEKLAQELYQAHRSRLRWRKVGRRFALVALVPLALLVVFWPMVQRYRMEPREAVLRPSQYKLEDPVSQMMSFLAQRGLETQVAQLPEEQRFLFTGENGDQYPWQVARSIARRWPDNPVYWAQSVAWNFPVCFFRDQALESGVSPYYLDDYPLDSSVVRTRLQQLLEEIAHGRQLEPDNGFYDYVQAAALLRASTQWDRYHRPWAMKRFECFLMSDKIAFMDVDKDPLHVVDPELFAQALAAFRRGMSKPVVDAHGYEMLRLRLDALGPPHTLAQVVARGKLYFNSVLFSVYGFDDMAQRIQGYALTQAREGQTAPALACLDELARVATQVGRHGKGPWFTWPVSYLQEMVLLGREAVFTHTQQLDQAQVVQEQLRQYLARQSVRRYDWNAYEANRDHNGALTMVYGWAKTNHPDPGPLRRAEYALLEKALIVAGMALWILLALAGSLGTAAVAWWQRRRNDKTPFIWIGWRRLAWIGLWSLVVPVGLYTAYVASPWSGRQWGLGVTWCRIQMEHMALWAAMLTLLVVLTARAVHLRARALGLTGSHAVPAPAAGAGAPSSAQVPTGQWRVPEIWARGILAMGILIPIVGVSHLFGGTGTAKLFALEAMVFGGMLVELARLLTHQPFNRYWRAALAVGVWAPSILFLAEGTSRDKMGSAMTQYGVLMLIVGAAVEAIWYVTHWAGRDGWAGFLRTVVALPPVLALAVLITTGAGYAGTTWLERSAVQHAVHEGTLYDPIQDWSNNPGEAIIREGLAQRDPGSTTSAPAPVSTAPATLPRAASPEQ